MKYFLYGYYGFSNFGDDLLFKCLIDYIEKKDSQAFFYVRNFLEIGEYKKDNICFTNIEKIWYVKKPKIFKILTYLKNLFYFVDKSDVIIIGPGGLF